MTTTDIPQAASSASRPLAGRRVLITRAPHQASNLAERLAALGAAPILVPTIEIGPPSSFAPLDAALAAVARFDLVAFTSANAVEALHRRAQSLGIQPAPRLIAAVGPATARVLEGIGLRAGILPPVFTAESLAHTLQPHAAGQNVLLVLAEDAPTILRDALAAAGARVTVAAAYANRIPAGSSDAMQSLFADPASYPDAITFTSASTATNLVALLQASRLTLSEAIVRASIGPVTSRALQQLGLPPHIEAAEATISALVQALAARFAPLR